MDKDVDSIDGTIEAIPIANVANKEAQIRILIDRVFLPHLELLQFVSAEDDKFPGPKVMENVMSESFSERARPPSDQNRRLRPINRLCRHALLCLQIEGPTGTPKASESHPKFA